MCGPSLNFAGLSVPDKREMNFFDTWKLERKKNEEIKGGKCRRRLVLFHIIQQMIHNICTKLQNHRFKSSWEIFDTNVLMYYIGVRDGNKLKRRQNKCQQLCFLSHNILDDSQYVRGSFGNYWDNHYFVKRTEHHLKQPTLSSSATYMGSWTELSHCFL